MCLEKVRIIDNMVNHEEISKELEEEVKHRLH